MAILTANLPCLTGEFFLRFDFPLVSHFTKVIGVYNLEGCVRQGFLPRLKAMDWSQSATIPADAVRSADHRVLMLVLVLWISSHVLYLVVALGLAIAWIVWRWRTRKRRGRSDGRS